MQKYEMLYIVAGELAEDQKETVMQKVEAIITKNAGAIENVEKIGMKKFAYPINYKSEGFYVLVNFSSDVETCANGIGKQLNITDGVVRHMIVAK